MKPILVASSGFFGKLLALFSDELLLSTKIKTKWYWLCFIQLLLFEFEFVFVYQVIIINVKVSSSSPISLLWFFILTFCLRSPRLTLGLNKRRVPFRRALLLRSYIKLLVLLLDQTRITLSGRLKTTIKHF